MDKLIEHWYSQLEEIPGKEFFNESLKTRSLCAASIATVLECELDQNQITFLSCLAYEVIPEEMGPLLFRLRRASYPPKDMFDSENLYDLEQLIKVAEYFHIHFIAGVLKEALRLHTIDEQ